MSPDEEIGYANALIKSAGELQRQRDFEGGGKASAEAIEILRGRAQSGESELFVPLAAALLIQANCLNGIGSPRALETYEFTVRLYGQLGQREPERFAAQFGCACNDLAWALQRQGRSADALEHAERAVGLLNYVLERDGVGLHVLGSAQVNLAQIFTALGRHADALTATREAVTMYEFLARDVPQHFAPLYVETMDDLREALVEVGEFDEALEVADRAAKLAADLSSADPMRFLPLIARMGNNVGQCHRQVGRPQDAVPWARNSVKLYGILVDMDRPAHMVAAIRARANLAKILAEIGQVEEALEHAMEALRAIEMNPDADVPDDVVALLEELAT